MGNIIPKKFSDVEKIVARIRQQSDLITQVQIDQFLHSSFLSALSNVANTEDIQQIQKITKEPIISILAEKQYKDLMLLHSLINNLEEQ